jgi:hypothetical protein
VSHCGDMWPCFCVQKAQVNNAVSLHEICPLYSPLSHRRAHVGFVEGVGRMAWRVDMVYYGIAWHRMVWH